MTNTRGERTLTLHLRWWRAKSATMVSQHEEESMVQKHAPEFALNFSDLDASIQSFMQRFDHYVQSTVAACDDARLMADAQRSDMQEHIRALERERDEKKHAQKQLWETVASERDADAKLRTSVQNLIAQREALVQRTASIRNEVTEMRAQLEMRKQKKQIQVQRLREQVRRNAPELAQLERLTGCSLTPSVKDGLIDITFSLLNSAHPTRTCTLSLDVSKAQYKVSAYDPALSAATIKALVHELSQSGNLYAFLKHVRAAMVETLA